MRRSILPTFNVIRAPRPSTRIAKSNSSGRGSTISVFNAFARHPKTKGPPANCSRHQFLPRITIMDFYQETWCRPIPWPRDRLFAVAETMAASRQSTSTSSVSAILTDVAGRQDNGSFVHMPPRHARPSGPRSFIGVDFGTHPSARSSSGLWSGPRRQDSLPPSAPSSGATGFQQRFDTKRAKNRTQVMDSLPGRRGLGPLSIEAGVTFFDPTEHHIEDPVR